MGAGFRINPREPRRLDYIRELIAESISSLMII